MPVRAIQARVQCTPDLLQVLWQTHLAFNKRLPKLLSILFKMRRCECGDTEEKRKLYAVIAEFAIARPARDGPYLLNSVSIPAWKPNTAKSMKIELTGEDGRLRVVSGEEWADEAAKLSAAGKLLYDKHALLGGLPETLKQMVARECIAIISGHQELLKRWESEHDCWLRSKQKWESDSEHQAYLAVRPQFEAFETSCGGQIGKRRQRWHRYLDWLRVNPQLAAWRGGPPGVVDLSPGANERIRKAKPRKARSVEAEEFWKVNPELAALDKLHGYYEREFVRRRKTKKNRDGFDHRPTFTLPDAVRHPRWFVFNAPQTSPQGYGDLVLPDAPGAIGSVKLLLLNREAGEEKAAAWAPVRFKCDPRLADFRRVTIRRTIRKGKDKGQEKDAESFCFYDRQLNLERPATISGIKLMFRRVKLDKQGRLVSADPYLTFTCDIAPIPLTQGARSIKWVDSGGKRKKVVVPSGVVTCAVDLGIRHIGFATLAVKQDEGIYVLRSRNVWIGHEEQGGRHPGRWSPGPDLGHLSDHKRALRRLRRKRGRPVRGEQSHIELQSHITHMGEDRFKKAAREIVNFALNVEARIDKNTGQPFPKAGALILESLATLLPDSERERGVNRSLIEFNRGHLVDRIREVASDCGLRVIEVSPVGTSQVCSRCGVLGRRYSIRKSDVAVPDIAFGPVEKLFACPKCGYKANSDHNASVNLHRTFLMGEAAVKAFREWQSFTTKQRAAAIDDIQNTLLPKLRIQHKLEEALLPF